MKRMALLFLVLFFGFASSAEADGGNITITALDGTTFIVVKDMGFYQSAIELYQVSKGKLLLKDNLLIWENPANRAIRYQKWKIEEKTD